MIIWHSTYHVSSPVWSMYRVALSSKIPYNWRPEIECNIYIYIYTLTQILLMSSACLNFKTNTHECFIPFMISHTYTKIAGKHLLKPANFKMELHIIYEKKYFECM